ncbi:RES domain-containing protein [Marinomonas arenicola]|uniref:RES domain-containing protein n=1 Tax=Marinomonas arenicola TaxID=569601 RepID=A0ABU9G7K8_9GAMM
MWRAQNGHGWRPHYDEDPDTNEQIFVTDLVCPYPFERMKPLKGSASEGRANAKGIHCLYVTSDKETAMSEVRPWLGSIMSVGQFKLLKDLKVIVFAPNEPVSKTDFPFYFSEPSDSKKTNLFGFI